MKFTFTFLFSIWVTQIFAQYAVGVHWNNTFIGNNIGVFFERKTHKSNFSLGLTVLFDNVPDYDNNQVFKDQGYGKNLSEKIGLNFMFSYPFFSKNETISVNAAYRFFYSHSGLRSLAFIPEPIISAQHGRKLYSREYVSFDAFHALEHYIGLNIDIALSSRVIFNQSIGAGMAALYDIDDRLLGSVLPTNFFTGQSRSLSYYITVGLKYRISRKEKTNDNKR